MKSITLSQLNSRIKEAITVNFTRGIWIRGEISEFSEKNGHAYLELIEKDSVSDRIVAKSKATCWKSVFGMLKPYFENTTGESLRAGLEVMLAVNVQFSEVYGLSLNIQDIDPHFTIGNLATRRLQIIQKLKTDGIFEMNKEVEFPIVPKRLAIISSETAAGYGDFCHQLENNKNGFSFYKKLFPAIMQGESSEKSIVDALDKIYNHLDKFDVVLILRGGGAVTDLASFDSYLLAMNVAQFPLPILTGIGHQRDISVVDMVAHRSLKTPTAVAEFLLGKMQENDDMLENVAYTIEQILRNKLEVKKQELRLVISKLKSGLNKKVYYQNYYLQNIYNQLTHNVQSQIKEHNSQLEFLEYKIENNSPQKLLTKGVSITYINGKRIDSIKDIQSGDKVETYLQDGHFKSVVV